MSTIINVISATTGQENFSMGSCKFHLFFSPSSKFRGREVHIAVAARDDSNPSVLAGSFPELLPAAPGYKDSLGKWTSTRYQLEEGIIVKLFGLVSRDGERIMASQYLQSRGTGALMRISMNTVGWSQAQFQSVSISGRFDLLSLKEATDIGVLTPPNYAVFHLPDYAGRVFKTEILEEESASRPTTITETFTNAEGKTYEVTRTRKRRALGL